MTVREQLDHNLGELLTPVTPTVLLKSISIGSQYKLPTDNSALLNRVVEPIEGEIITLSTVFHTKERPVIFENYKVHFSWLRALGFISKFIKD